MSLSSSLRIFSPKLPLSLPSSKPISRNTPFLSSQFPSSPSPLLAKTLFKTPLSSSFSPSSISSLHPIEDLPPNLQTIIKLFQSVQDPRSKYEQLLFYGRNLPPLDPQFKNPQNKVQGCVSQVWVRAFLDADRNVRFEADSDSVLTKGLAALLVEGLSGRPPVEIASVPPDFVQMLGLKQSLTPSRNNGFLNMLRLMQKKALDLNAEEGAGSGSPVNIGVSGVEDGAQGMNSVGNSERDVDSGIGVAATEKLSSEMGGSNEAKLNPNHVLGNNIDDKLNLGDVGEIEFNSEVGSGNRAERIKERLEKELNPVELEVEDISYQHAGHAGARGSDGETHFNLKIVSKEFEGKSLVKRHRIVYNLLQDELQSGLHALSIVAKTPAEVGGK